MQEQTEVAQRIESDAAFAAGFASERGLPPPEVKAEEKTEAKAEEPKQEPEAKAEDDPLAGFKAELESMREKQDARLRNIEGHIGGLNSQLKTALATAKAVEKTGGEAPSTTQIESAASSSAKWKALKEDFPDWVDAMDGRLAEIQAAIPKANPVDVDGLKAELTTNVTQLVNEAGTRARQMARVDAKYEDWEETVKTPEFETWFETQTPEVKALGASAKASDAIRLLDSYEDSRKKTEAGAKAKAVNEARLKSAITPKGVPSAQPTSLNDVDAFERGFKKVNS